MVNLDKLDLKLLSNLDVDARQSNQQIARKLRTSKEVIAYRISKLEKQGIIRGYQTIINTSKLGFTLYRIFLRFENVNEKIISNIIDFLKSEEKIWWIGDLEGRWDFLFGVWSSSPEEFKKLFDKFNLKFRKYIAETLLSIILSYQHYDQAYLMGKRNNYSARTIGIFNNEKIDDKDIQILKLISDDARIPLIKISERLNLESSTILYRLRNLKKKKIILGYRPILDFNLLNYDYYVVKLNLNDTSKIKGLKEFVLQNPNVIDIIETIGGYDFDFDIMVNNQQEYHKFIKEIKNFFPIKEIEYFRVLNNYKLTYFPF